MKFFYWLFLNLGLSTVHIIFWRFFAQQVFAKTKYVSTANFITSSSIRLRCKSGVVSA